MRRTVVLAVLGSIGGALAVWWILSRDGASDRLSPASVPAQEDPSMGEVRSENDIVAALT